MVSTYPGGMYIKHCCGKDECVMTHEDENDKAKQQTNKHHRVDDRQPVDLQAGVRGQ